MAILINFYISGNYGYEGEWISNEVLQKEISQKVLLVNL